MFAGCLQFYLDSWSKITLNSIILSWIQGYRIPFKRNPPSCDYLVKHNFSHTETALVRSAISDLLRAGAIIKSEPRPEQFISSCFLAEKPNGMKRFILILKQLNEYVDCPHFKMEDLRTAIKLTHKNVFMCTIDWKDAYVLLPVRSDHQQFLKFHFEGQLYQFTCLPLGLCTAPLGFTKLKPVVSFLRTLGISAVNYLDDFLTFGESFDSCLENVNTAIRLFKSLGLIIDKSRSILVPTTRIRFTGLLIDSVRLKIELPDEKKNYIVRLA